MVGAVLFPREHICCFSGHRNLPEDTLAYITERLDEEIENLLSQGVMVFVVGGALGFDYLATLAVIRKREANNKIKLICALPYPGYDTGWEKSDKLLYNKIIPAEADEVIYVSEAYSKDCFKKRNQFMVQNSQYCICALRHNRSGTGQTVRMGKADGLTVINLLENNGKGGDG
jgi:uncharacterized phage-like protein YoqJ